MIRLPQTESSKPDSAPRKYLSCRSGLSPRVSGRLRTGKMLFSKGIVGDSQAVLESWDEGCRVGDFLGPVVFVFHFP